MITKVKKDSIIQECNCGAENEIEYENIKFRSGPDQFVFPVCPACKTRIEFIFFSENMKKEEFQFTVKMKQRGLME